MTQRTYHVDGQFPSSVGLVAAREEQLRVERESIRRQLILRYGLPPAAAAKIATKHSIGDGLLEVLWTRD